MQKNSLSICIAELAIEDLEISTINNELTDNHETISDALANTRYIDNIQDIVTDSNELSQSAMKSINLAIESIYQNLGAPVYKYMNTLSLESLNTYSYKRIAFEDIQIFVKDLWVKIKESVNKLWEKINEFWQNNFSSLGKIKATLDAVLVQINEQYKRNTIEQATNPDVNLIHSFNNGKDIDQKTIDGFINAHYNAFNTMDELVKNTRHFNKFAKNLNQDDFENEVDDILENITKNFISRTYRLGSEQAPIITGRFITIEYVKPENTFDIEFMTDEHKVDPKDGAKLYMLEKDKLRNVVNKTLVIIRETIKYRDIQSELQKEFNNLTAIFDKHMDNHGIVMDFDYMHNNNTKLLKNYKKTIRAIYRINVSIPKILGTLITSNIKLARSVVQYSHFCLIH